MNIAICQMDILWKGHQENLNKIYNQLAELDNKCDLFVLPEMFNTGFSMDSDKISEDMNGETIMRLREWAKEFDIAIMGSIAIKEGDEFFNRMLFISEHEEVFYDKRHLFRMSGENDHYSSGSKKVIISYKGVKILPLVCYDLRFPVWSRNRDNEYDLIVYVASWPDARIEVWNTLLKARAIENQCYVIGANRVGADKFGTYSGKSVVIGFYGNVIADCKDGEQCIIRSSIDIEKLKNFREKFPVSMDADNFIIGY